MATTTILKAEKREGTGKGVARKLRQSGRVPAVLYGRDMDSIHLSLDTSEAELLFYSISVDNTIIELTVAGEKKPFQTLVREIQTHPWKAHVMHVDFLRIQKGVAVDVDVPLKLIGIPVGVRLEGGIVEQIIHDLPIRCIPSKIPEVIEVDISELILHESMHISDVTFEEGIEVTIAPERTICSVAMVKALEVESAEEDEDAVDELGAEDTPDADADGGDASDEES